MWFFSDEHKMLQDTVRQFAATELAPRIEKLDHEEGFNREAFRKMGELGLLGITVPEADGGAGLDAVAATIAMEEMGAVDASTTLSYLAHTILCVNQIGRNGSPEQKKKYLPKLISGEWIGGMGMSEPGAGSDALGMTTKAVRDGDDYVINGSKTWITNGPNGDVFLCLRQDRPHQARHLDLHDRARDEGFFHRQEIFQNGHARLAHRRARFRQRPRSGFQPRGRRKRQRENDDAQPRHRAHHDRGHLARHRARFDRSRHPDTPRSANNSASPSAPSSKSRNASRKPRPGTKPAAASLTTPRKCGIWGSCKAKKPR